MIGRLIRDRPIAARSSDLLTAQCYRPIAHIRRWCTTNILQQDDELTANIPLDTDEDMNG